MHCRWYPSITCRGSALGGVCSWGGQLRGSACSWGEVPAIGGYLLPGRCLLGDPPKSRRLLLRTVRSLLECILVVKCRNSSKEFLDIQNCMLEYQFIWRASPLRNLKVIGNCLKEIYLQRFKSLILGSRVSKHFLPSCILLHLSPTQPHICTYKKQYQKSSVFNTKERKCLKLVSLKLSVNRWSQVEIIPFRGLRATINCNFTEIVRKWLFHPRFSLTEISSNKTKIWILIFIYWP